MNISPGSEEERLMLGRWIKMGRDLIISSFPLGESIMDPKVERSPEVEEKAKAYVEFDHVVGEKLTHLKGKFRYALETYYRDTWGPYLPSDEEINNHYG